MSELDDLNAGFAQLMQQHFSSVFAEIEAERNGSASQRIWECKDGWLVGYTTERVKGGPHDGRFVTLAYKPNRRKTKKQKPSSWALVYRRAFAKRKTARARAVQLYEKHCGR